MIMLKLQLGFHTTNSLEETALVHVLSVHFDISWSGYTCRVRVSNKHTKCPIQAIRVWIPATISVR